MLVSELYSEIHFLTETDSASFQDVDKLRGLNIDQGEALFLMLKSQGFRKVGEKTYYTDFVSITGLNEGDNGYIGEYSFDSTWVKPTEFYVKYPTQTEYQKCQLYDMAENPNSEFDEDAISDTFSETSPYVRFARDTFFVRPLNSTSTVSDGIMVLAEPRNGSLTQESDTPILDSIFHRWYVLKEALRFGRFRAGINRSDIEAELSRLETRIKNHYSERLRTPMKLRAIVDSFK